MENIELVEVRKAGNWVVAVLGQKGESENLVYIQDFNQGVKVKLRDYAEFRTNTSDKIGSEFIMNLANFMDFSVINNVINSLLGKNIVDIKEFYQLARGKIYYCFLQLLNYDYAQDTSLISQIEPVLKAIFEFYLNLLLDKLNVKKESGDEELAFVSAFPEIESVFLTILGFEEAGAQFYNSFRQNLQLYSVGPDECHLDKYSAFKIIEATQKILDSNPNQNSFLPFIEIIIKCTSLIKVDQIISEQAFKARINNYLENLLNSPIFILIKKDFTKIFDLLLFFNMSKEQIVKHLLKFLVSDITITQKLQIFSSLDKIEDKMFSSSLTQIKEKKHYLKTLENESLLQYLIKYIVLLKDQVSTENLLKEILKGISERDIFIGLVKVVAENLNQFNYEKFQKILGLLLEKYSTDCKQIMISLMENAMKIYPYFQSFKINLDLYSKIEKKVEAIYIIKNAIVKVNTENLFKYIVEEALKTINSEFSNNLFLALIETEQFCKVYTLEDLLRIINPLFNSNRTYTLLSCLSKFKNHTEIVENSADELFTKSLTDEKTLDFFFKFVLEIKNIDKLKSIAHLCYQDLHQNVRTWPIEEKGFLILFLKINSGSLIYTERFWENSDSIVNVYRKGQNIELENELSSLFFMSKLSKSSEKSYKKLIIELNSKFNTSSEWTKEVIKKFIMHASLNYPNSLQKFKLLDRILEFNPGLEVDFSLNQIFSMENEKCVNGKQTVYFRRLLQRIPKNKVDHNELMAILEKTNSPEIKAIIIEKTLGTEGIKPLFLDLLTRIDENFMFGEIVFYILLKTKHLMESDLNIPVFVFNSFVKVHERLYSESETNECFEVFFDVLRKQDVGKQVEVFNYCLILIFQQECFEYITLIELLSNNIEDRIKDQLMKQFLAYYIRNESLKKVEISTDAEELFASLLTCPNELHNYENSLLNDLVSNQNDIISKKNLVKLLIIIKRKQSELNSQDSGYGHTLSSILDNLLYFKDTSELLIQKELKEKLMILFAYYPDCRQKIKQNFHSLFSMLYLKLKSKRLNFSITLNDMPRSILNFGSTCYVNSIIQLILEIEPISNEILSYSGENKSLLALKYILFRLRYSAKSSIRTKNLVNNYELYEGCYIEKTVQGDAEEFFNTVLYKVQEAAVGLAGTLAINITTKLICDCKEIKKIKEVCSLLHLEVKGLESIEKSIEKYLSPEKFDESNALNCDMCHKKKIKQKEVMVDSWPNYLICALKRFKFNLQTGKTEKLLDDMVLRNKLELGGSQYEIFLIVSHLGTSEYGHYITQKKIKDTWYNIDDLKITELDDFNPESISSHPKIKSCYKDFTPYLILYKKQTGIIPKSNLVQLDEKLDQKNNLYSYANIYCGLPMILHFSHIVKFDLDFCVYLLIHSFPYQEIETRVIFDSIFKTLSSALEDPNCRARFVAAIKGLDKIYLFEVFTSFASSNYKLVLKSIFKKSFSDCSVDLLNILASVFGCDHLAYDFTFIIDLFVEVLEITDHDPQYENYLMYYFFNRVIPNYSQMDLKKQGFEFTDFSSFFKYMYSKDLNICSETFKLEFFSHFISFSCFQLKPKHYSKLMAKYVVKRNSHSEYFNFLCGLNINPMFKQRLVYDYIEENKVANENFESQQFIALIEQIRYSLLEIKNIEKIIKALSRKFYAGKNIIAPVLNMFKYQNVEIISKEKGLIEIEKNNKEKLLKMVESISKGTVYEKKSSDLIPAFMNDNIELDAYGDISVISSKNSLILVKRKI